MTSGSNLQNRWKEIWKEMKFLSTKHSEQGSLMIWAALTNNGPIDLVVLKGKLNEQKYKNLLEEQRIKITGKIKSQNFILQQNNIVIATFVKNSERLAW